MEPSTPTESPTSVPTQPTNPLQRYVWITLCILVLCQLAVLGYIAYQRLWVNSSADVAQTYTRPLVTPTATIPTVSASPSFLAGFTQVKLGEPIAVTEGTQLKILNAQLMPAATFNKSVSMTEGIDQHNQALLIQYELSNTTTASKSALPISEKLPFAITDTTGKSIQVSSFLTALSFTSLVTIPPGVTKNAFVFEIPTSYTTSKGLYLTFTYSSFKPTKGYVAL